MKYTPNHISNILSSICVIRCYKRYISSKKYQNSINNTGNNASLDLPIEVRQRENFWAVGGNYGFSSTDYDQLREIAFRITNNIHDPHWAVLNPDNHDRIEIRFKNSADAINFATIEEVRDLLLIAALSYGEPDHESHY